MISKALIFFLSLITTLLLVSTSCNIPVSKQAILTDSTSIRAGQVSFTEKCAGCHNFQNDGIGPHLAGLTAERPVKWIKEFIKDPKAKVETKDTVATKLLRQFKTLMPSFSGLTDAELDALIAYINTHKKTELHLALEKTRVESNPIPDTIPVSDIVVGLQPFTTIPHSSPQPPLTRIVKMDYQPGTNDLFIVDLRGILYRIRNGAPEPYMEMKKVKPKFVDKPGLATGFGSFAFHPEFQSNGLLYTTHTEPAKSGKADFGYHDTIPVELQWVLTEWKTGNPAAFPFAGKGRELLRVNVPTGIHGVQEITFNRDAPKGSPDYGLLYVGVGDGGSTEIRTFLVSPQPHNMLGSIIRIDPAGTGSRNGKYDIPETNPFFKTRDPLTVREIYAWGFRNPHKINWSRSGQMFTTNVGELNVESLYLVEPGHFYGWPIREGSFLINFRENNKAVYPLPPDDSLFRVTYPVAQFDHDEGTAICGGFEYRGSELPELQGKYVFGDMASGKLFYVEMKDLQPGRQAPISRWNVAINGKQTTLPELCNNTRADMRFGMDHTGELYIFTKQDGRVYRLVHSNIAAP